MQLTILAAVILGTFPVQVGQIWRDCSTSVTEAADPVPECASFHLPLRYDGGEDSIAIAAMRITYVGSSVQLWFLDGGPGDAGTASLPRLAQVLDGSVADFYTLDHRGVGGSALLNCPEQQAPDSQEKAEIAAEEWGDCIDYIVRNRDDLDALTATNAAMDLGHVIEAMREPDKRVVIMGVSYGSYLAQRYLQLFPSQPDAVILDGIVPPDWTFAEFDAGLDEIARRVLRRCADDSDCNEKLGPDPISTTETLLDSLATGHCNGIGLTPQLTRLVLGSMLMVDAVPHAYVMGFVHRVRRCEWHDRLAVLHMFREVFGDLSEPPSHSPALQRHVALSELWPANPIDTLVYQTALNEYVMTTEVSASFARTAGRWPVYERSSGSGEFAAYDGPMLLLHGTLDPTMPLERLDSLRAFYAGTNQTFIAFPDAGHVVINESGCATEIYHDFLRDPEDLSTDCLAGVPSLELQGSDAQSKTIFGTGDLWGDSVGGFHWSIFVSLFRLPAILVGLTILVAAFRKRSNPSGTIPGLPKTSLLIFGWVVLSAMFWMSGFVAPLLMRYTTAILLALVLVALHVVVGLWFVRKLTTVRVN